MSVRQKLNNRALTVRIADSIETHNHFSERYFLCERAPLKSSNVVSKGWVEWKSKVVIANVVQAVR